MKNRSDALLLTVEALINCVRAYQHFVMFENDADVLLVYDFDQGRVQVWTRRCFDDGLDISSIILHQSNERLDVSWGCVA